ncbi:MAG: ParB N-terminal domain-containing protein, partial [Gemmatimonadota bacterium]
MPRGEVHPVNGGTDAKKKTRLGKGLGALLGEYMPEDTNEAEGYRKVAVVTITPNPLQPRREFAVEQLAELEASIRANGLLQPLVVRPASQAAPA